MGNTPSGPLEAVTGHSTYKFGDLTRTLLQIPRAPSPPAARRSPPPAAQNAVLQPEAAAARGACVLHIRLAFPRNSIIQLCSHTDVRRARSLSGSEAAAAPASPFRRGSLSRAPPVPAARRSPSPPAFMESTSSASREPAFDEAASKRAPPSTDFIWTSFFNRAFEVGEVAVSAGLIAPEDVEDQEVYLFLGLPALTLLEAVLRSLPDPGPSISMSDGLVVTPETCPPEFKPLFSALSRVKTELLTGELSSTEQRALRAVVLYAGDADKPDPLEGIAPERSVLINRVSATVQGVATAVSQLSFFKASFNNVLVLLSASVSSS